MIISAGAACEMALSINGKCAAASLDARELYASDLLFFVNTISYITT
jgi:hypothetical protein